MEIAFSSFTFPVGEPYDHVSFGRVIKPWRVVCRWEAARYRRVTMFSWALTFFIVAIVAALLGFTGIAGTLTWAAKLLFIAGLILAVAFFLMGRRPPAV